jgi:hypothetical protein
MTLFEPRPDEPRAPRRGLSNGWLAVIIVSAVLAVLIALGVIPLPPAIATIFHPSPMGVPTELQPEVAAVADEMYLTDEGMAIFAASRPRLADADEVSEACGGEGFHGCYSSSESTRSFDTIVIYQRVPGRIDADTVITAAHELLHAAYMRLDGGERARVDELLETEILRVSPDDPVHEQIAGSLQGDPTNRSTELFAYLGTQFLPAGGMAPELEAIYSRFIADRAALVRVYTG